MASVVRRASLLVRLIFQFVRCNIFQKAGSWIQNHTQRKTKVVQLKRKLSTVDENDFFDICGTVAAEEESTANDRCGTTRGENRTFGICKNLPKKKKKTRFRKNKVSPIERIAWKDNNGATCTKKGKSRAASIFSSQSTKASNRRSEFDKPFYQQKNSQKFSQASNSSQGATRERAQVPGKPVDDMLCRHRASQKQTRGNSVRKDELAKPGTSTRGCHDVIEDLNSSSLNQRELLGLASPEPRSKVTSKWKGFWGKNKNKTIKTGWSLRDSVDVKNTNSVSFNLNEREDLSSSQRSKISFNWKGFRGKKGKKSATALNTGSLPTSHRSKISVQWKGFRGKKGKKSAKTGSPLRGSENINSGSLPSSNRSKSSFKWTGVRKQGKLPNSEASMPQDSGENMDMFSGARNLKEQDISGSGQRSKIRFTWNGFNGKKDKNLPETVLSTAEDLHVPKTSAPSNLYKPNGPGGSGMVKKMNKDLIGETEKASRLSRLIARVKQ